ncbi:hypothetical protein [Mesorhizobium sp. WSM4884]|uniref:hypothetical protein n=1 Tax=Mesorhizobium sp. WSM4884 TaxID=3038542 RepID=UPI002415D9BB|nr:hypothetical protein [Mesorhizobium sp. WSM4884]MDG4884110.1 hypothetical protein [Mesorhizobium sp. WSM4884]
MSGISPDAAAPGRSPMGAGRIIPMSRHDSRQKLAREFGATDSAPGTKRAAAG